MYWVVYNFFLFCSCYQCKAWVTRRSGGYQKRGRGVKEENGKEEEKIIYINGVLRRVQQCERLWALAEIPFTYNKNFGEWSRVLAVKHASGVLQGGNMFLMLVFESEM